MKVLIVDGFSSKDTGRESFKKFYTVVRKAFEFSRKCGVQAPYYSLINRSNIRQYIYNCNSDNNQDALKVSLLLYSFLVALRQCRLRFHGR